MDSSALHEVLRHYELGLIGELKPLGNAGGFSGAQLWKIASDRGKLCLRLWPHPYPDAQRLGWIHQVLAQAADKNVPVAAPLLTRSKESFVSCRNRLWELSPWIPGEASFNSAPSMEKLQAAIKCLAKFHQATVGKPIIAVSPSIRQRFAQLEGSETVIADVRRSIPQSSSPLRQLAIDLLPLIASQAPQVAQNLQQFMTQRLPVGPVIRDVHHDHLLFAGEQLAGVIDFGSMEIDTRTLDIARLVGSLRWSSRSLWKESIEIYEAESPLKPFEAQLIPLLHRCNVTLGSLNWLKWLFCENRTFENPDSIQTRLENFKAQLLLD